MLDQKRLKELLGFYISKFPLVSNAPQHHEMLKWKAVAFCVNHLDIEEADFGTTLKNSFSVLRSLIDYGGVTP